MESAGNRLTDAPSPHSWADLAAARQTLFEARDSLSAAFLLDARVSGTAATAGPPRLEVPPFVFSLEKPIRPRGWWKRRAFAAHGRKRQHLLLNAGLFDASWYQSRYPDIAVAGVDPIRHFLEHGSFEGRSPGPHFDALAYMARYPDVVMEGVEPWLHFVLHGQKEGRSPV